MKNRYIITSIVLLLMPLLVSAQYLKGSYFLSRQLDQQTRNESGLNAKGQLFPGSRNM